MAIRKRMVLAVARRRQELSHKLTELLSIRDNGLITQAEYELALEDLRGTLPGNCCLTEVDLRNGGSRFVLRDAPRGEVIEVFEFRRSYCPDF